MMQKILVFLEKNVEWFAVALGAAFLGFIIWTYLVNNTVQATFLTFGSVNPGDIDQVIYDGPATDLKNAMDNSVVPHLVVPNFTDSLTSGLTMRDLKPKTLVNSWDYEPLPPDLSAAPGVNPQDQNAGVGAAVSLLPKLPAAMPIVVAGGQSTILDVSNNNARKDINWATVAFVVPAAQLQKAWKDSFDKTVIHGDDLNTDFLSATLYRSQKLPNGQWSDPVEIARPFGSLTELPYPADGDKPAEADYRGKVASKQEEILTPKFPELAPEPAGTQLFDLTKFLANPNAPTPDANGNAAQNPAPTGMPATQPDAPNVSDPQVVSIADNIPKTPPAARTASFNPEQPDTDILIQLHDPTVRADATYRYRVTYKILNPLFGKADTAATHKEWTDQFALEGPPSDWSPEFQLKSKTSFYCSPIVGRNGDKSATFDVYTFSDGQWHMVAFRVNPGDPIGAMQDGVDYSTGYTFVEARTLSESERMVAYMDDDGAVTARDATDDERKEKNQAPKLGQAGAPGAPGNPGATSNTPPPRSGPPNGQRAVNAVRSAAEQDR
jgi:hypothetical protein